MGNTALEVQTDSTDGPIPYSEIESVETDIPARKEQFHKWAAQFKHIYPTKFEYHVDEKNVIHDSPIDRIRALTDQSQSTPEEVLDDVFCFFDPQIPLPDLFSRNGKETTPVDAFTERPAVTQVEGSKTTDGNGAKNEDHYKLLAGHREIVDYLFLVGAEARAAEFDPEKATDFMSFKTKGLLGFIKEIIDPEKIADVDAILSIEEYDAIIDLVTLPILFLLEGNAVRVLRGESSDVDQEIFELAKEALVLWSPLTYERHGGISARLSDAAFAILSPELYQRTWGIMLDVLFQDLEYLTSRYSNINFPSRHIIERIIAKEIIPQIAEAYSEIDGNMGGKLSFRLKSVWRTYLKATERGDFSPRPRSNLSAMKNRPTSSDITSQKYLFHDICGLRFIYQEKPTRAEVTRVKSVFEEDRSGRPDKDAFVRAEAIETDTKRLYTPPKFAEWVAAHIVFLAQETKPLAIPVKFGERTGYIPLEFSPISEVQLVSKEVVEAHTTKYHKRASVVEVTFRYTQKPPNNLAIPLEPRGQIYGCVMDAIVKGCLAAKLPPTIQVLRFMSFSGPSGEQLTLDHEYKYVGTYSVVSNPLRQPRKEQEVVNEMCRALPICLSSTEDRISQQLAEYYQRRFRNDPPNIAFLKGIFAAHGASPHLADNKKTSLVGVLGDVSHYYNELARAKENQDNRDLQNYAQHLAKRLTEARRGPGGDEIAARTLVKVYTRGSIDISQMISYAQKNPKSR